MCEHRINKRDRGLDVPKKCGANDDIYGHRRK
jgi:hypothetical protein